MKKIIFCCLLFLSLSLNAKVFERIVVFGDSLSDTGNIYKYMMHLLPKSPPYYKGHFSNGPMWTEGLFQHFMSSTDQERAHNFAVGGAAAVIDLGNTLPFSLATEVKDYLYLHKDRRKDVTLFLLWIGGNNYINYPGHVEQKTEKTVAGIQRNIENLIQHGAEIFFIPNLPDLGGIPRANQSSSKAAELTALSNAHNKKLKEMITQMRKVHPNVQFIDFDIKEIWDDLISNPASHGITNTKDACYKGSIIFMNSEQSDQDLRTYLIQDNENKGVMLSTHKLDLILNTPTLREAAKTGMLLSKSHIYDSLDCAGYVFWDDIHPTTYVHQKISQYAIQAIEGSGLQFKKH